MQRDNFLAIINGFATLDAVLMKHLEKGAKNAKMVSWQIQIGIIECLSEFVWSKIKDKFQITTQLWQMRPLIDYLIKKFYYFVYVK